MRCRTVMVLSLVAACAGGTPASPTPAPVNGFRPEDRVVIGDFTRVNALAATTDRIYVVYPTAVAIWKPLERRWDVPRSPPQLDQLRRVTGAVVDPLDRTLWLAAGAAWIHYDPVSNRWDDGVFAVPPRRLPPIGHPLDAAMRDLPQLRALAPALATGPLLQRGVLTTAARDPQGNGWYLGTSTRGLLFFDRMATQAEPMPLGLSGDVVGAITIDADGVWVATDNDGIHPAGVTHLAVDLGTSATISGNAARGLPFNLVRRILPVPDGLLLATDRGVVRLWGGGDRIDRVGGSSGSGDERTLAMARHLGRIYAGTTRGLAQSRADSSFAAVAPGVGGPVSSLLSSGDTLWVGTATGLYALLPGSEELLMSDGFRQLARLAGAIMGIGYVGDTLVAMTTSQVLWRDPRLGGWSAGPDLGRDLGPLVAFEPTSRGAWVGGARGAAFVGARGMAEQFIVGPDQLPGDLTAIAARGRYLWIGTRRGLVRFRLTN